MTVSPVCVFLVLVCVYGIRCTNPVRAEIDQLKLLYQQMDAKLQEVAAENQRLKATVTKASHHANYSTIAFTARLSADTELAAIETVKFDDLLLNLGSAYDPATGLFTARESGLYQLAVSLTSGGKEGYFVMSRNGNDGLSYLYTKTGLWFSSSSVLVVQLNEGDTVQVKSLYFPANLNQGKYSVFSGFLIK